MDEDDVADADAAEDDVAGGGSRIHLVQGPPGTGKTHLICGLVTCWLHANVEAACATRRVLICAQSNAGLPSLLRTRKSTHLLVIWTRMTMEFCVLFFCFDMKQCSVHVGRFCNVLEGSRRSTFFHPSLHCLV